MPITVQDDVNLRAVVTAILGAPENHACYEDKRVNKFRLLAVPSKRNAP